jgi:hypothetical protein
MALDAGAPDSLELTVNGLVQTNLLHDTTRRGDDLALQKVK